MVRIICHKCGVSWNFQIIMKRICTCQNILADEDFGFNVKDEVEILINNTPINITSLVRKERLVLNDN